MLALAGTRLGADPAPSLRARGRILLVEGVADMLAARSRGWPAIAVPGDHAWQARWAQLFASRNVTIAMDCDRAGRDAARRIARDLGEFVVIGLPTWTLGAATGLTSLTGCDSGGRKKNCA